MRFERSYLFCPGDRPERFAKALAAGADRVVIDLEDAVLPEAKARARGVLADWLGSGSAGPVMVRINAADTPWHEDDVRAVSARPNLVGFMLPKAESPEVITKVRASLGADQVLVALVETVRAVAELRRLAGVPGLQRLAFGSVDFCAEAGIRGAGRELDFVRGQLVLESALAGLAAPIEGVTLDIRSQDALVADVETARRFGFGAKLCVHPGQVATVNAGFSPTPAEIEWARRVVSACGDEFGAVVVDGKLVDRPVRLQAETILRQAS